MRDTERRDPKTVGLDLLPTAGVVDALIGAYADIAGIVARAAPSTTDAVDGALAPLRRGGRLVFVGSGTSGWLVEADAVELPPTFGFPPERLVVVRARSARASAGAPEEDAPERGGAAIAALGLGGDDVVVALAASGSTPFTVGAAERAAGDGAFVITATNVAGSPLGALAAVSVTLPTGAEPVMGSTRMRAGVAQRMWLSVFSTALMVRLGLTYDNLMVNVAPALEKLRERRVTILAEAAGVDPARAAVLLEAAQGDLRVAIVMALAGRDAAVAQAAVQRADGRTREALALARQG